MNVHLWEDLVQRGGNSAARYLTLVQTNDQITVYFNTKYSLFCSARLHLFD